MTPEEKAKELVDKFYCNGIKDTEYSMLFEDAVECALICVNEIINEGATQYGAYSVDFGREKFWYKVKDEITTLK